MPIIEDFSHPVIRMPVRVKFQKFESFAEVLKPFVEAGHYLEALDVIEQALLEFPAREEYFLQIAAAIYETLTKEQKEIRLYLYQARFFEFGIKQGDKVLDVGSGHLPFPYATHLSDISTNDHAYGRAGIPFKHVDGKPVFECNVEELPFEDNFFDFVYCSHVLEHTENPEKACSELQRVAKRGFIETPNESKDLFLNTAKISHHLWSVGLRGGFLEFRRYTKEEIEGFGCDALSDMIHYPQGERNKAFTALLDLKADKINTMAYWEGGFDYRIVS